MDYTKALSRQLRKSNGRKIVLISEGVLGAFLMQNFEKLHVSVERYIDFRNWERESFCLPEELAHREKECFVIVVIYSGHKRVAEELVRGGYRYNIDCVITSTSVYVDEIDRIDPLLGYTREGVITYGKSCGKDDLAVLVLGNSTSDHSVGNLNSWPYCLYQELAENLKQNVIVYNGGVAGYHSGQELLKLCRDGLDLKPNIVISFSGVTEVEGGVTVKGKKLVHKYQWRMWQNILTYDGAIPDSLHMRNLKKISAGMEEQLTNADIWIQNERKMYALCKEFDVKFFGCLQPMISEGCVWDAEIEALLNDMRVDKQFYITQRAFIKNIQKKMRPYCYMKDLTEVFAGKSGMYFDTMHYTEKGNRIIAKSVADMILNEYIVD